MAAITQLYANEYGAIIGRDKNTAPLQLEADTNKAADHLGRADRQLWRAAAVASAVIDNDDSDGSH